jgi:hypothetical protein
MKVHVPSRHKYMVDDGSCLRTCFQYFISFAPIIVDQIPL